MFDERLQGIDVTSMLDESLQQKIGTEVGSTKKYPAPETQVLINHVPFLNFEKTLQVNSLYFRRYSTYQRSDEIKYEEYNDIYMRYLPESERDKCNHRNETLSGSVYVLPMYNSNTASNLHLARYAAPKEIDSKEDFAINKAHLAVFYNWKRLFNNLKEYAWRKALVDSFEGTPIVSLSDRDRIFCGGIQYLDNLTPQNVFFDPADAIVPFFLKERNNEADNEYRICTFINPGFDLNGQIEHNELQGIYIQVGNVLDIIDRIVFYSEKGLVLKDIKEQFEGMDFVEKNKHNLEFNWNELSNGSIALIIKGQSACTNNGRERHKFLGKEYSFENSYPIESNQSTLYSTKYDSMKQRYILMNGNREYNYRCYNATLKLEMLLFGKVTITDAQYYDGLLFKEMMEHGDFEDFITCSHKHDSFKVKIRCDNKDIIQEMYCKQFYPSSIKSYALGRKFEKLTEQLKKSSDSYRSDVCSSIDKFITYLKEGVALGINEGYFNEELDYWGKCFTTCKSVYKNLFSLWNKWSKEEFDKEYLTMADLNNTLNLLKQLLKDIGNSHRGYQRLVDMLCQKLDHFEKEMIDVGSLRSDFYSFHSEVLEKTRKSRVNLSDEAYEQLVSKCNRLINEFNRIYNTVIAKQHRCLFIDMIPKEHPTSPAVHVNVCFDPRLSQFLFLSSWKDFDMLCSDPYIQAIRRQISSVWESLLPDDPALSHDDEAELKDLFLSLDAALQECYLPILNRLVGNISTCIFNSEAASSNYFRIEKLTFGNGKCGHFIGSGCFLNDSYTDKLSLYLPNERHRITIFDLCFGKYLDDENCNAISYTNTERF